MSKVSAVIPDGIRFADLKLARNPDTGAVSFDWAPIERICEASNLPIDVLRDGPEDNVAGLIVSWYAAHRQSGGAADPVADDLIAEAVAEEKSGQQFSHQPGQA